MKVELYDQRLIAAAPLAAAVAHGRLPWQPESAADLRAAHAAAAARTDVDRPWLAATLAAYQQQVGNDAAAVANAQRLALPGATVVVTGQQAGLFTGPLYMIYKTITAINLARRLEAASGQPVVPVLWIATEDHDLGEIATAHLPGRDVTAAFPAGGLAVEALSTSPAVTDAIAAYLATRTDGGDAAEVTAWLRCEHANYGAYIASLLARLFAGTGLVLLEPRLLRPHNVAWLQDVVRRRVEVRAALAAGAARLQAAGLSAPLPAGDGFGLFRIAPDGRRRQVLLAPDGGLLIDGAPRSEADMLALMAAHPERSSTGVYLRPICQTLRLPVAASVLGPGEFNYHLQLRELFDLFGVPMPLLRLRNHATVVTAREERLITTLALTPADYFAGPAPWRRKQDLPPDRAAAFDAVSAAAAALESALATAAGDLLNPATLGAFNTKLAKELETLRDKARREHLRRAETDNARIDRFFAAIYPHGDLQERSLNILHLIEAAGLGVVAQLLGAMDPDEARHYLVYLARE